MKKIIILNVALFLILLLSSCSGSHPVRVASVSDIEELDPNTTYSVVGRGLSDKDISSLAKLDKLQMLFLNHGDTFGGLQMSDARLKALSETELPALRYIGLSYSKAITDEGMLAISKISSLRQIITSGLPGITDKSLEHLAKMPHLEELFLRGCPGITDEGIQLLRTYPSLRWVMLGGMEYGSTFEMKKMIGDTSNIDMSMETQVSVEGFVKAFRGTNIEIIHIDTLNPDFFTDRSKALFCRELSGHNVKIRTMIDPKSDKTKSWRVSECDDK